MSRKKPDHHTDIDSEEVLSKTQKKQMVHDLQALAKSLVVMPKKKIKQLDLPSTLLDAIDESNRIASHIARKRHFQYMGKILLKADHESIKNKMAQIDNLDGHYQIRDEVINLWIEQFATHETTLFDHLYQFHEHEILSNLRQVLRNHRKKPAHVGNRKKLFQTLRDIDKETELPNPLTLIQ